MKSEEVMKIFAHGENQPNLFTIHFYFLLPIHMGDPKVMEMEINEATRHGVNIFTNRAPLITINS